MSYKLYPEFLSNSEFKIIQNASIEIYTDPSTVYHTNHTRWESKLTGSSNAVLTYGLEPSSEVFSLLSKNLQNTLNSIPLSIMFYYWSPGSYINWHTDGHYSKAATLYLNDKWDKNGGGYYMASQNSIITAIKPERNLLIFQSDNIEHCTTSTHNNSPIRATVQIFFK